MTTSDKTILERAILTTALILCAVILQGHGEEHSEAQALSSILQGGPDRWEVLDRHRRPIAPVVGETLARPSLRDMHAIIRTAEPVSGAYRITLMFSVTAEFRSPTMNIRPSVKDPADRDEWRPWYGMTFNPDRNIISLSSYYPEPDSRDRMRCDINYHFDGNGTRQLGWPETLRRWIEHESAAMTGADENLLRIQGDIRPGHVMWHFNGLLTTEYEEPGRDTSGHLEIQIMPGVSLIHADVTPLAETPASHIPVSLTHSANAASMAEHTVDTASLPAEVNGVPFVPVEPDATGNTHLDIGASWFQEGALTGHLSGRGNGVGARWRGAFHRTPARLAFSVPRRRYRAIHLLAAASGDPDTVPVVTAQFYRPQAGFPESFSVEVPDFNGAGDVKATPVSVKTIEGSEITLYHVTIPIDPGDLAAVHGRMPTFAAFGYRGSGMEFELTKDVRLWRGFPDPSYYSIHAAGLPSSVRVYAMTLEKPRIDMAVTPALYAHVFTAPVQPRYTVTLKNKSPEQRDVAALLTTASYDELENTAQEHVLSLAPGESRIWNPVLALERYGLHHVTLTIIDGEQTWKERFSLAYLHADTRERGDWEPGRGPRFGWWRWGGSHLTPGGERETLVMGLAGADTHQGCYGDASEAEKALARRFGMATYRFFSGSSIRVGSRLAVNVQNMDRDAAEKILLEGGSHRWERGLATMEQEPSDVVRPRYVPLFSEPHLGRYSTTTMPEYWGGDPLEPDAATRERADHFADALLIAGGAIRERWPDARILVPWGDPMFAAYLLRWRPDVRPFVDGIGVDIPGFERLPEMQMHQVVLHRLYQSLGEVRKMLGREDILLPMLEGPCISDYHGAVPPRLAADLVVRNCLILLGYGVEPMGGFGAFHTASYWGEQHYGGGLLHRSPLEYPKPMYTVYATMTRHLNRRNFETWLPTGSLSAYRMRFAHYRDGSGIDVLWQLRGIRKANFPVPAGTEVRVYDGQDNARVLKEQNGIVSVLISSSPVFVYGLSAETPMTLGAPEHPDSAPAGISTRLATLGDGSWRQIAEADKAYETNHEGHIKRTPGIFEIIEKEVASEYGGRALAVRLGEQNVDRETQPYYTQLAPGAPIEIPGQAEALGLWARANSDWGRIVYVLSDAKGERWISIGTRDAWNCDDIHSWSAFNFDGWRYLTFELPGTSPWDNFRHAGTVWWGSSGGDGIVDLPLTLERVIVERRQNVMYLNDPQPANTDDVLLGALYAEYASEADATDEAVRRSRIRRPVPEGVPDLPNQIAKLREAGTLPPVAVERITIPDQDADGTRCYVHFPMIEGAESYSIWAAPYKDGTGAVELASGWKESGGLIRGLRPETDFWLFIVVSKKENGALSTSRPEEGFHIRLENLFAFQ